MASGGVSKSYGPEDLVKVMRSVVRYLESPSQADLLLTQGLLRVSGTKEALDKIYLGLIDNKSLESMPNEVRNVHNVIGAAKQCFIQAGNWVVNPKDPSLVSFREKVNKAPDEESKARALKEFIDELANSGDPKKVNAAEIMYSYIHLATLISEHGDANKMTSTNSAIVIGAGFQNVLSIVQVDTNDPMAAIAKANEVNDIFTAAIDSQEYKKPFREEYRTQYKASRVGDKATAESDFERLVGLATRLEARIRQDQKEVAQLGQLIEATMKAQGKNKAKPAVKAKEDKSKHLEGLMSALHSTVKESERMHTQIEAISRSIDALPMPVRNNISTPDRKENRPPSFLQSASSLHGDDSPLREASSPFNGMEQHEKLVFIDKLLKHIHAGQTGVVASMLSNQTVSDLENIHTELENPNHFPISVAKDTLANHLFEAYQAKVKNESPSPKRKGPTSSSS